MNNKIDNIDKLYKKIKYAGFGKMFNSAVESSITAGKTDIILTKQHNMENIPSIQIHYALDVKIDYGKSKAYYNGFTATVIHPDGKQVRQWFSADDRITAKEAENLMRDIAKPCAVYKTYFNKEGLKYGTWYQINFKVQTPSGNNMVERWHENYGFNLKEKLKEFDFVGFSNEGTRLAYQERLERGEIVPVMPVDKSVHELVYIYANPGKKTIHIEDAHCDYLAHDQFKTEKARQQAAERKSQSADQGTPGSTDFDGTVTRRNSHEPRQQLDDPDKKLHI